MLPLEMRSRQQWRTPLFHCVTSKDENGGFIDNHAIIKTLLRYGCKDADFDPNDLKERFLVDLGDRFDELRKLVQAESEDLSTLTEYNPSFVAPSPFNADVELCKGWTLLQIAATLGTTDLFFFLLNLHAEDSDFLFGDPAQQDYAAVTAARASHVKEIKSWGDTYGRLLDIYKIDPQEEPKHISETCMVIFAFELNAETGKDRPVALKFMKDKDAFQREIDNRTQISKDSTATDTNGSNLVIRIIRHHELKAADLAPFNKIKLSSNHTAGVSDSATTNVAVGPEHPLKYLLVMDKGAADLSDIISHSNVAGRAPYEVLAIAVKLAECLRFLGDERNVMHGDVKSRNFVDRGEGFGFAIIDLDAAAEINGTNLAGQKVTSSGCLPPEQAAVVLYNRMQARRSETHTHHAPKRSQSTIGREAELKELKEKLMRAIGEDRFADVSTFSAQIEKLNSVQVASSSGQPTKRPPNILASHTYDMWGYGVLLFQLCAGRNLFEMDFREEVDDDELAKIAAWSDDSREKAVKMCRVEEGKGWPKALISRLLSENPEDRPATWAEVIEALKSTSGGNSDVLAAIEKGNEELSAKMDKIAAQASEYAKRNEALHVSTQTKVKEGFKAMRQLMMDLETIKCPYVYEVANPKDIAQEKAAEQAEQKEADAADAKAKAAAAAASSDGSGTNASAILKAHQASKDLKKRLGRAKRFFSRTKAIYQRTKDVVGKASELKDDFSVEKLKGVATQFKKGETYKLRLLCGITFETVVEYEFTEKEYGPKMKKLAQVGSVIASCAIKLGTFANPIGKVASFIGYPMPEIPVEKIEGFKSYLDEVAGETDTQGEWAALKEQAENGMDLDAINAFGELLQKLIDAKRGDDWRGKLVPWEDPNNPGMVTFIDAKQYPKHTWSSGDDDGGNDGVEGGGGGGDGDDDTLCSGDDNDDGAGSVDNSASKSSICAIL